MSQAEGHRAALAESWARLADMDLRSLASNSGAESVTEAGTLVLRVIDEECTIDFAAKTISRTESKGPPNDHLQILILHYLLGAGNAQLANRPATYHEFDGGALYYSAFKSRTIDRVVKEFGQRRDLLEQVGAVLHAEPIKMGSVAFKVNFFPKIPVTVVMWLGDEEVSASANLLFDANAGKIMPTEDLSVLGGELVNRLVALARA